MQVRPVGAWKAWDPFTALARMDRDFDELVRRTVAGSLGEGRVGATFVPAVEVAREGEDVVVRFELPGVDVERDVTLEVERGRPGRRAASGRDRARGRRAARARARAALRPVPPRVRAAAGHQPGAGRGDLRRRDARRAGARRGAARAAPVRVPVTVGARRETAVLEHEERRPAGGRRARSRVGTRRRRTQSRPAGPAAGAPGARAAAACPAPPAGRARRPPARRRGSPPAAGRAAARARRRRAGAAGCAASAARAAGPRPVSTARVVTPARPLASSDTGIAPLSPTTRAFAATPSPTSPVPRVPRLTHEEGERRAAAPTASPTG